jgi:beclin 1
MSDAYVHASRDFRKYHSHVKDTKALSEEYNALKTTSVLDDSYYICCDGLFGTINGFKLGRLTSIHVSWVEINAALGQCVLLLDSIAKSAAFEFSKFELIPFGSFPKIKRRNDNQIYELFGGQKRVLWNRNFDSAMQGFLTCLSEIGVFADRAESCKLFPHEYAL